MPTVIGRIEAIYRYPVKSMQGEALDAATLGWHGVDGDRHLALRRVDARGGNPWLSAERLPELVSFGPLRRNGSADGLPTHVRTPQGGEWPVFGEALAAEVGRRHGAPVEMMRLHHGIFDEASIATVRETSRLAETRPDVRRFRPNLLVRSTRDVPLEEDEWVGGVLAFGDSDEAPAVAVTMRDPRCGMVNIDPDGGSPAPDVLKACVRADGNHAGIYCTVTRTGRLGVGQTVVLRR